MGMLKMENNGGSTATEKLKTTVLNKAIFYLLRLKPITGFGCCYTFISFLLSRAIQILLPPDRTSYESNREERNV